MRTRLFVPGLLLLLPSALAAQGLVRSRLVLDDGVDSFQRCLGNGDRFGSAVASLGDLNGDGLIEFAVGASGDRVNTGAVWIFSLSAGRSIRQFVKVGPDEGGIEGQLDIQDRFGSAVTAIGDVDGDGILDLAVGAPGDDDGFIPPFSGGGAVWVLLMNGNGTVREFRKFSQTQGNFAGQLDSGDNFGASLAAPGDLDGNGVPDLIVGAPGDDDGPTGSNRGALWIVLLDATGDVLALHKISGTQGGGAAFLVEREGFGTAVAVLGDLDGDGHRELAVGSDRTGNNNERLRILSLASDGSVFAFRELAASGNSGHALAAVGDFDGNGVNDLAAGDTLLRLAADGSVLGQTGLPRGAALAGPGDTNGNGLPDLVIGKPDEGLTGLVEFHDIAANGSLSGRVTVDSATSGLPIAPSSLTEYGRAIAPLGDLDGDGEPELAVGDPGDTDGGVGSGAVWVHFIDGTSGARVNKISRVRGAFPIQTGVQFGSSLAPLGDLDGNGSIELAVGAPADDEGRVNAGAVYVLFLRPNGTVNHSVKLSLALTLGEPAGGSFGREVAQLDDLDGDGRSELAVATSAEVYVLFLDETGNLRRWTRIDRPSFAGANPLNGGLTWIERTASATGPYLVAGTLTPPTRTYRLALDANGQVTSSAVLNVDPSSATFLGDLDGDGIGDLAHKSGSDVAFEFLTAAFTRKSVVTLPLQRIPVDDFGPLGDLTGDGVRDLAVRVQVGERDRMLLLELDGIATAGFERRDALDNLALENGRQIPRPHPGRTFVISSEGANLGAALFDSTPGGPNAASQDPDLLVGSGNVLMLQDSLTGTQSVPGIFDRPNDDRDGGLLALDLPRPVRARSLELIDQDTGLGTGTTVTLIDENGRTRTYYVPPGFTEDVHQTGTGGWRTLRLDTLNPQPGYLATATASQQPGFLDAKVRRIEVQLSGSGAIDDFLYDPWP